MSNFSLRNSVHCTTLVGAAGATLNNLGRLVNLMIMHDQFYELLFYKFSYTIYHTVHFLQG